MNLTLREEDRSAVDLLLDRSPRAAGDGDGNGGGATIFASADPSLGQRVAKAQQLLQLLEWLPTSEPSADLVGRTLRVVDQGGRRGAPANQIPALVNNQRPVA